MDLETATHKVRIRIAAVEKLARDLHDAFVMEKAAVDKLLKEFTKLRKLQVDGYISADFVVATQASEAWLYKVGTEEQLRLRLPWAKGIASLNAEAIKPLVEVFEYNFANATATTSGDLAVEKVEDQATWEIEQEVAEKRRHEADMVKIALRRAVSEDHDPEWDTTQDFIVGWLDDNHGIEVGPDFVKEVLTEMGYFDPNVQS